VGKSSCRAPGWPVAGQHRAEKPDVRIARRRSDQPCGGRFGPCPHRSSRDTCQRSSDQRLVSSAGRARVGRYVNSMDAIHTWSLHSQRNSASPAGLPRSLTEAPKKAARFLRSVSPRRRARWLFPSKQQPGQHAEPAQGAHCRRCQTRAGSRLGRGFPSWKDGKGRASRQLQLRTEGSTGWAATSPGSRSA
jgi:hypothetical protein